MHVEAVQDGFCVFSLANTECLCSAVPCDLHPEEKGNFAKVAHREAFHELLFDAVEDVLGRRCDDYVVNVDRKYDGRPLDRGDVHAGVGLGRREADGP